MEEEGKVKQFTRRALFDIMQQFPDTKTDDKLALLERKLIEINNCPDDEQSTLARALRYFKSDFKAKWVSARYIKDRFIKNNEQWLSGSISLPCWTLQKVGRPVKDFDQLSDRSKRRITKELRQQVPAEQLVFAASTSQRAIGNTDASKLIKEATSSPTRAIKYRRIITTQKKKMNVVKKHTPEEALAIFVEGDFTRKQWEVIQGANKNIYPCYSRLKKAKKVCYPPEECMRVTETCAEIQLQALIDHTVSRICKYADEVINTCIEEEKQNMQIIIKWGCDGSQQSQFKQKFENSADSDRLGFARKFSREQCNRDVLQRLLLTSDPFLSSSRSRPKRKSYPFSKEALGLLVANKPSESSEVHSEEEHSDDDDDQTDCEVTNYLHIELIIISSDCFYSIFRYYERLMSWEVDFQSTA